MIVIIDTKSLGIDTHTHNLQLINKRYCIQTELKGQALGSIKTIIYNLNLKYKMK